MCEERAGVGRPPPLPSSGSVSRGDISPPVAESVPNPEGVETPRVTEGGCAPTLSWSPLLPRFIRASRKGSTRDRKIDSGGLGCECLPLTASGRETAPRTELGPVFQLARPFPHSSENIVAGAPEVTSSVGWGLKSLDPKAGESPCRFRLSLTPVWLQEVSLPVCRCP